MSDEQQASERPADPTMQSDPNGIRGYCADCAFWDPLAGRTSTGDEVPLDVGGVCRKGAPARGFDTQPYNGKTISEPRPAMWFLTAGTDWCGDHPLRVASARVAIDQLVREISEKTREIRYLRENPGATSAPRDPRARKGRQRS